MSRLTEDIILQRRAENKRKATRFNTDLTAYYYFGNKWEKCKIYDLNIEGAGLRLSQFLIKGDPLKVRIDTETDQAVFDASVVNVNGPRIGVIFQNISELDRDFLTKIINGYTKRYKIT